MLLGDFLEMYRSRKNEKKVFQIICQENNISYKKLRPYLKEIGFNYDQKSFDYVLDQSKQDQEKELLLIDLSWLFPMRKDVQQIHHASADPEDQQSKLTAADMQILSAIDDKLDMEAQRASSKAARQKKKAAPVQQPQIISDQLFDIVDLLQQINNKIPAAQEATAAAMISAQPLDLLDHDSAPLALQLHRISQSEKTRKTINISAAAGSWLDKFSATKGYKIGDLVTLAVMQLKERIDPHEAKDL